MDTPSHDRDVVTAILKPRDQAHVDRDRHQHDQNEREGDSGTIGPVPRLQEQVDERIAYEEHLAAAKQGGDQEFLPSGE